jgi:hypothetical protein
MLTEVDPSQRAGVLTLPGYLGSRARNLLALNL